MALAGWPVSVQSSTSSFGSGSTARAASSSVGPPWWTTCSTSSGTSVITGASGTGSTVMSHAGSGAALLAWPSVQTKEMG